jgi:type II secretory pathway pseudopilin PulG
VNPNRPSPIAHRHAPRARRGAFTLIEVMITVSLLGFMVLGLMAMFSQTQRAFKGSMAQTDVLEGGRAATDIIARELEETTASGLGGVTNFFEKIDIVTTNTLVTSKYPRTNVTERFFNLIQYNQKWFGLGYVVALSGVTANDLEAGTLYRYQSPSGLSSGTNDPTLLASNFEYMVSFARNGNISNDLVRVIDGVVHLRVLAYTTNGVSAHNSGSRIVVSTPPFRYYLGEREFTYTTNAVPMSLELEIGILENSAWAKYKSLPTPATRSDYLRRQAGRIHVFRRHITVANADPDSQ